jgi:hypothetical protein
LAKWLGVSHTYIQKLTRTLSRNENDFMREVARSGVPTHEGLSRAREESRQQRERGWLRTQRRWKTVEYKLGDSVVRCCVPTKPNAATLVANNPYLPDAPTPAITGQRKPDGNAIFMWNLKMKSARERALRPWRPGKRFLLNL